MADWTLSIDFGTSSTAAVVTEGSRTEVVEVDGAARIPSMVAALADGTLVAGAAAVRQLAQSPERVERAPKRRLGDRAVLLGEQPVAPSALAAAVLRVVADEASRRRGGSQPCALRLTHPASWASTRLEALRAAARLAGLPDPDLLSEPVAAAVQLSDDRVAVGALVAVYDLGGGTFDAAVLRRTATGFVLVGPPGGNDRIGGEDLDEKLLEHVGASIRSQDAEAWERLRFSDERPWRRAAAALRTDVQAAKETLSVAPDATVYVPAPVDLEVRVTREELESLARHDLERTVEELVATVDRSGARVSDLAAVYLVGGASRMPLVGRLVAEGTGVVPTTWGDPKVAVALGAATAPRSALTPADQQATGVIPVVQAPTTTHDGPGAAPRAPAQPVLVPRPPATAPPAAVASVVDASGPAPVRTVSRRAMTAVAAAAAVVIAGTGVVLATNRDDGTMPVGGGQPPVVLATYDFAVAGDAGIRSERSWALDVAGTELTSTTVLTNPGAVAVTRTAVEVVPKEVAASVDGVRFAPGFAVVQADPAVRYAVTLQPGASRALVWTADLPSRTDQVQLSALGAAQRAAERALEPSLRRLVPAAVLAAAPLVPFTDSVDPGPAPSTTPSATPAAPSPSELVLPTRGPSVTTVTTGPAPAVPTPGAVDDPPAPPPPPPARTPAAVLANRAPTLSAISSRTSDEVAAVSITLSGSDPEGGSLTYSASGLPSGLRVSGNRITGTVSSGAASVTTDRRQGVRSRAFSVSATVRDSKGLTARRSFTLTVRDTHTTMPNYIGTYGCGRGCGEAAPDVAAVTTPGFSCYADGGTAQARDTIWRQGLAPGSVLRWGASVKFWYYTPDGTGCENVARGW